MAYRLSFGGFDDHASAIGYVCITWSILEAHVNQMVAYLCGIQPGTDESRTLTNNIDFRRKLEIIQTMGFLKKPNDEWWADTRWLTASHIDNDLRNRRNRFVHDVWIADEEGWIKRQERTAFQKQPEIKLETFVDKPVVADEIWQLAGDLQAASVAMQIQAVSLLGLVSSQRRQMLPPLLGSPWTEPDHPQEPQPTAPEPPPPP